MDKINIGTDIKLTVYLTNGIDPLNIHSVQAYLINTSVKSDLENLIKAAYDEYNKAVANKADKILFISRFPMEPHINEYRSTCYDVCQCGYPHYHTHPRHCRPVYCGFGVHPHTFDGFRNHLWAHYDLKPLADNIKCAEDIYHKNEHFLQYQALVELTNSPGKIRVYFPGKDQLEVGIYKLVIVAQVYQPGYSKFLNLKTVVVDYDNAFELVYTDGGDAEITVGIAPTESQMDEEYDGRDRYVYNGEFDFNENTINLRYNDGEPAKPINVAAETGWFEQLI